MKQTSEKKKLQLTLPGSVAPNKADHNSRPVPEPTQPGPAQSATQTLNASVEDHNPVVKLDMPRNDEPRVDEPVTGKLPKALRELETYNKEGLLDQESLPPQTRLRSGKL